MYVDIEQRSGPDLRVWVNSDNPRTAIRIALEQNPGPGIATIQGKPYMVGRQTASGLITITITKEKEKKRHGN